MESFLNNAKEYLKSIPKNKLYLYLMLLVAIVGGSVIGLSFLQKEDYQPLFAGLSTEDASMVVAKLKEQKIPYKLGVNGTTISVPKEKMYDVRLVLASQNALPGAGGIGLELFDKTNYGMTEFMQNVNYKRAIQGELTRTINQMPEVKASRIHIAIPEKTLFTERERETTASVFLKLKQGRSLAKEQVAGIVHLVAGSIEGLKAENVVVIDSSGKILHKNGENSAIILSGQQYELQRNVERRIEDSIQSMLETFLLNSKSIVRASVELNLRKVEKLEEEYSPEKTVVSVEKKSKEKAVHSRGGKRGGVPGAAANEAVTKKKQQEPKPEDQNVNQTEREDSNINYEVSKSVRKIVEPYGDIKRISLAVLVDGKYEKVKGKKGEELKYIPRSQQELNNIRNLVLRAAGFNEERGDKIEVLNMPFEVDNLGEEKGMFGSPENKEMVLSLSKYMFYLVIAVCLFLFVLKPMFKMFQKREEAAYPLKQVKDVYVKTQPLEPTPALTGIEKAQAAAVADALKDKALVGSIIREWVKENP
jgi:flagellar M-ring protein FliF